MMLPPFLVSANRKHWLQQQKTLCAATESLPTKYKIFARQVTDMNNLSCWVCLLFITLNISSSGFNPHEKNITTNKEEHSHGNVIASCILSCGNFFGLLSSVRHQVQGYMCLWELLLSVPSFGCWLQGAILWQLLLPGKKNWLSKCGFVRICNHNGLWRCDGDASADGDGDDGGWCWWSAIRSWWWWVMGDGTFCTYVLDHLGEFLAHFFDFAEHDSDVVLKNERSPSCTTVGKQHIFTPSHQHHHRHH